jgi:hypothetical protein
MANRGDSTVSFYSSYINDLTSSGLNHAIFTGNILQSTIIGTKADSGGSQEFFLLGTPVPEPTTMIAGALLLLPFGASTVRILRRKSA